MRTYDKQGWRILEPGEIIKQGDQARRNEEGAKWFYCFLTIGEPVECLDHFILRRHKSNDEPETAEPEPIQFTPARASLRQVWPARDRQACVCRGLGSEGRMLVACGYHAGDLDQAQRLADWIRRLGPYPGHSLLVARDVSTAERPFADVGFDSVQELVIRDDVWNSWALSANNVFRKLAKHIEYTKPEPWLLIEPDCVPMHRGWLDEIAAEYIRAMALGKVFLGAFVHGANGSVDHCSGVAVYPGNMTAHAGMATIAMEIPWDVEAASQILPKLHHSERIMHRWKHPAFTSLGQVRAEIGPQVALFHASKDGSLIGFLKQDLSGGVEARAGEGAVLPDPTRHADSGSTEPDPIYRPEERLRSGSSAPPAQNPLPGASDVKDSGAVQLREPECSGQNLSAPVHNPTPHEATAEGAETLSVEEVTKLINSSPPPETKQVSIVDEKGRFSRGLGETHEALVPWESPVASIEEIKRLSQELKRFCTAPAHIGKVRAELARAGIIQKSVKHRRKRK